MLKLCILCRDMSICQIPEGYVKMWDCCGFKTLAVFRIEFWLTFYWIQCSINFILFYLFIYFKYVNFITICYVVVTWPDYLFSYYFEKKKSTSEKSILKTSSLLHTANVMSLLQHNFIWCMLRYVSLTVFIYTSCSHLNT